MSAPTRVFDRSNPHVQWFEPPIDVGRNRLARDSLTLTDEGVGGITPELWGIELRFLLERLGRAQVGRAVISSIQRRTTIYPGDLPQTDADPYADNPLALEAGLSPEEARLLAATTGANAMIWINPSSPIRNARGAQTWSPDASLLHELVHAVNITCGAYQDRGYTSAEAQRRGAPSGEEEIAWVIDNMYRSERGMWLRDRYSGQEMREPERRPIGGWQFVMDAVSRCNRMTRMLAVQLEHLDIPYNPFREYAATLPHMRR